MSLAPPSQPDSKNARRDDSRNSATPNHAIQPGTNRLPANRQSPHSSKTKAPREVNHVRLALLVAMLFTILVATMFRTPAIVFMAAFLCAAPLMGFLVGKFLGRGLAVSRQLPEVGTSGDVVVGRLMLEQRGRIPTFLVHLRPGSIEGGAQPPLALHGPVEYVVPMLRPGESAEWSPQWRLGRRGVYQIPPVQAGARDPLGLFTTAQARTAPASITILPRPVRVARLGFCGGTQHGAHAPQAATTTADATDFHGIRTWRPGEAIRRVHWKSTVRTGELHVVEWEEDPGCDLTVLFDARSFLPSQSTQTSARTRAKTHTMDAELVDEALETQITLAASIAAHLQENGRIFRFFSWQPTSEQSASDLHRVLDEPEGANFVVRRHRAQRTGEIPGTMRVLAELQALQGTTAANDEMSQQCSLTRLAQEVAPEIGRGSANPGGVVIVCSTLSDHVQACARISGFGGAPEPFVLAVDPLSFVASANAEKSHSANEVSKIINSVATSSAAHNVRIVRRGDSLVTALER